MTLVMTHVDSTINIVLVIIIKLNHDFWRIPLPAGLTELRMCLLLLALKQENDEFLRTYTSKLEEAKIDEFTDEEKREVLSAVVVLLRRHSSEKRLCYHNSENDLQVTDIDHSENDFHSENDLQVTGIDYFGFVTQVKCKACAKPVDMDTTCYDAKWAIERIHDKKDLKRGDHICWQRPYIIWHHAIVSRVDPLMVIHYDKSQKVSEAVFSKAHEVCSLCCRQSCSRLCNTVYRVNYEDCYTANYTVLRAKRLLYESRYNLVENNCEHFSTWCKTGSSKSSQISIVWASLGKIAVTIGLRLIALFILFLIQWSHEEYEEEATKADRGYEITEKVLTCVYIAVVTMIFVIHLLITYGSQIAVDPGSNKLPDAENPCPCVKCYDKCTGYTCCQYCLCRCFCCTMCSCYALCCQRICALFCFCCRHIKCTPTFTCCRRPGNLACGLFFRIFFREIPGLIGTLGIVVFEDKMPWVSNNKSAIINAGILIGWIAVVQFGGYVLCQWLGRWVEVACHKCDDWQYCRAAQSNSLLSEENQTNASIQ